MDLPIDHFRLLGVSPAADAQTVLRTLQLRLDRVPDQGFTQETLDNRAELLRRSADLLSDNERRPGYEAELTALAASPPGSVPGLEISPSKEVAALLLLLEAGQAMETFEAARRALQPPQAPTLGSSREADLALLAGLASQAAADEYAKERRYETAALVLQQGLQLLQKMGQLPQQRQALEQRLNALLPYRVLDLLSRDLAAVDPRLEGLRLLEQLVEQRGGLEGHADPSFSPEEFQAFFKQIRPFLTVQEQVDLFSHWAGPGSPTAGFLASYALTASGISQRKPERIAAARERLIASGQGGMEPYLACLSLLLGQIEEAQAYFEQGASEDLLQWAAEQGDQPLAGLYAYCLDWLHREVLPGYRDIKPQVDLEAWFADRDVQLFVEQQDRRSGRSSQQELPLVPLPSGTGSTEAPFFPEWLGGLESGLMDKPHGAPGLEEEEEEDGNDWQLWEPPQLSWPSWGRPAAAALLAAGMFGGAWLVLRPLTPQPARVNRPPAAAAPRDVVSKPTPLQSPGPLESSAPSEKELSGLLERWLKAKSSVLSGASPDQPLDQLARPALVSQLERQKRELEAQGQTLTVTTKLEQFSVINSDPDRIEGRAKLSYSEQLLNRQGLVIEKSGTISLNNVYVFARNGGTWRVAALRANS